MTMKQLFKFILCLSLSFVFWPLTIWIIILKNIYKFVRKMFIILKTLPRDIRYMYIRTNFTSKMFYCQQQECSVVSLFRDLLKKYPTKPCCYFENQVYTYQDIEDYSNKVANVFQSQNYKKGDVISLVMENCTEYVCIWLGLAKIGVTTALINTNLRGKSLIHCINSPKSKAIIYSEELKTAIENIEGDINLTLDRYQFGGKTPSNSEVYSLNDLLTKAPTVNPTFKCPKFNDSLLYIYTSGTTGFPKPVIINHSRFIFFTYYGQELLSLQTGDIIYTPIPLYHTAGGVLGLGAALILGVPIAIRKKFSASAYFSDCAKFKCTIGQYIGEIGRYIISTPIKPEDKFHNVKKMIGVGMRGPVWKVLKTRFGVKDIVEMYGATESNIVFGNLSGKLGSFGYIPRCVSQSMSPFSVIKINVETGEPIRGKDGFCIRCDVGESGMLIGKIISCDPVLDFTGYLDEKATKSKILHNVFVKDDKAFMSGDLVFMDEEGYLYFKDRTGDSYRWKGENVSTSEVETIVSGILNQVCTAYGVKINHVDGRVGMLAINDKGNPVDFGTLLQEMDKHLPRYAQPHFIRIMDSLPITATFKVQKVRLQEDGFNPDIIKDKIYFKLNNEFVLLTSKIYNDILSGKIRL